MINQKQLPFKLEITKNKLTAHSGLVLATEYNNLLGLNKLVDLYLPSPGSNKGFNPSTYVSSLITMFQGGGRNLDDIRDLKRETELLKLAGLKKIPGADATGDWLRRMGNPAIEENGLSGLDKVRKKINSRILAKDKTNEYTLDADATEIRANKYEAKWTYNSNKGYMPMLGFLAENQICIYDEFREGNVSPNTDVLGFYRLCKERMPSSKKISYFRGDGAYYQSALVNELEEEGVKYVIRGHLDDAVKNEINKIEGISEYWEEPVSGCGYEMAEIRHSMDETKKGFRLVIKREETRQPDLFEGKYIYRVLITNYLKEEKSAYEVLTWFNQRANAENYIKELKIGFGMEQLPCGQSYANAVFFRIGVLAYNLFTGFKNLILPSEWKNHTIQTIRWKLFQIAGKIIKHARQLILKVFVDNKIIDRLRDIRKQIYAFREGYA